MKHLYPICCLLLLTGARGLHAQVYIMPASGSATVSACSGTITDPGGLFGPYSNSTTAVQVLRPTTSARRVSITFTQFRTEASYDQLRVHDGASAAAPVLAVLSGTAGAGQTYTATNAEGALTLRFTSDNSLSDIGWSATLSCVLVPGATAANVGVGTTAPEEKLEVAGIVYSTQGGVRFPDGTLQPSAATDAQQLSITGSTISLTGGGSVTVPGDNLGNHTATQNLGLNGRWLSNNGDNEGLRINNAGQVGINTNTPQHDLDVNGTANVRNDLTVTGSVGMGYTMVTANDNMAGNSRTVWTLPCPAGMRVLGGGGGHRDWNSAASDIVVNYSGPHPDAPETQWRIIVTNNSGSSRATRYYCICARMAP